MHIKRTFIRHSGWLTGATWAWLAHGPQMCCFSPVWLLNHCLGSIHIIIYGYSYATRLGWIFYVIFTRQANHLCIE